MTPDQARQAIVAEWLGLHPSLRATEKQLADYAKAAEARFRFRQDGDRVEVIRAWLAAANRGQETAPNGR